MATRVPVTGVPSESSAGTHQSESAHSLAPNHRVQHPPRQVIVICNRASSGSAPSSASPPALARFAGAPSGHRL